MNLKEKWTKQNNSVKMLLRKLKRHDTVVVAIAVVIAVVLCGGLIYLSTPVVAASAKDELVEAQTRDNEQTIEKLDELSEYLNGLDKSITESKDSMTSFYEKDGEKNTEKMTNTVTEKVGNLGNDLAGLHDTITRTGTDIDKLREMIEKGGEDSDKSITEKFTNIYNNLEEIENTYNKTHENTKSLIEELENALKSGDDKLSKDLVDRYKELLNELTKSNEKLAEQNSDSLKELKNVSTSINDQFTDLNMSFQGDMTDLKGYISGEISGMNNKLDQVFQRVSNGKKLLASTLLTKNVEISEDATFAEIAKAIENIPVKIVLDKDDVPGEVVYEYHHHTDGNKTACDVEYVPIDCKGGCYTEPYVHKHTDDCYDISVTYTYYTTRGVEDRGFSHFTDGVTNRYYRCSYCRAEFINDNPGHHETTTSESVARERAENFPKTKVTKTLKCTKPEGTLLGYKTECNLIEGQVVSAKIVFADEYKKYNTRTGAVNTQSIATSLMMAPQVDKISDINLWDDFEFAEPAEREDNFFWQKEKQDSQSDVEESNSGKSKTSDNEESEITKTEKLDNNIVEGETSDDKNAAIGDDDKSNERTYDDGGRSDDSNDESGSGNVMLSESENHEASGEETSEDDN